MKQTGAAAALAASVLNSSTSIGLAATSLKRSRRSARTARRQRPPGPARRHGLRQDLHGGMRHRATPATDPALAHNKTLAAQLCAGFAPTSQTTPSSIFVSYYDYYQPEVHPPDGYLHREDTSINEEIEPAPCGHPRPDLPSRRHRRRFGLLHLRHRRPIECSGMSLRLAVGDFADRDDVLRQPYDAVHTVRDTGSAAVPGRATSSRSTLRMPRS